MRTYVTVQAAEQLSISVERCDKDTTERTGMEEREGRKGNKREVDRFLHDMSGGAAHHGQGERRRAQGLTWRYQ